MRYLRVHQNPTMVGGTTVMTMGQYAFMNAQADGSYPTRGAMCAISPFGNTGDSSMWFWWFGYFPGPGQNNAWQFYGAYNTTPNNLGAQGGFTGAASFESTAIGWNCPGVFGYTAGYPIAMKNSTDPSNYDAWGVLNSGYYTSYDGAFFCHRSSGGANAGGNLISFPVDYGDLLGTMPNGVTRSRVLENTLCCGNAASKFNSPNT